MHPTVSILENVSGSSVKLTEPLPVGTNIDNQKKME